ncbi:preprotein translocase subunit SecY [Scatolibacter rhodanostii]|uniref:preprotein translocase subunit SecY n=1 Tax=Scatolibacter rhodanostii TaxID=2014781 RepID=UPI000C08D1DC|nr:preprotein translocase subunit SecY [Scatolibacter rhodanostii]
MLQTLKNAWKIPDLRKKILFTLAIVVAFRFGSAIPMPFLNMDALSQLMNSVQQSGGSWGMLNMMTGDAFSRATLFALGISPYINSSIIMQLLQVAIPALERLAKEGEVGRKKIAMITRFVTVGLGLITGIGYYFFLRNNSIVNYTTGFSGVFAAIVMVLSFTAGTAIIMWMGEQINDKGIGNGISILLFAGIVARLPVTFGGVWEFFKMALEDSANYGKYFILSPLFVILFLGIIWLIIFMNEAERRIPVQYAKKVVGRKMYGGQSSFLPIKVAMSGVMPVIFASSILSIPSLLAIFISPKEGGLFEKILKAMQNTGGAYMVIYFFLILMFAYFYMVIQYNPIEMANNLRQSNGTIPGIRPGRPTSDFISKILSKVTLIGALFLSVISIVPMIYGRATGMASLTIAGTSTIIMVGVALETVKQLESQMMMRHYKGFLD